MPIGNISALPAPNVAAEIALCARFCTWIERYQIRAGGEVKVDSPNGGINSFPPTEEDKDVLRAFFVPKLCNHCTETPCVQVCPVGASYRTKDGVILVDHERCIGCVTDYSMTTVALSIAPVSMNGIARPS